MFFNRHGMGSTIVDQIEFKEQLSAYGLFEGKLSDLLPAQEGEIVELSSSLFSDYADKQRVIWIPKGSLIRATGDGLPDFPDGTIIAKTFFYTDKLDSTKRRIIETRLLIKDAELWNAATYQWNAQQDEALIIREGATVPVEFVDDRGRKRKIGYKIPSRADCNSCHRQQDKIFPIGLKIRNLNRIVHRDGSSMNQLAYLQGKGILQADNWTQFAALDNYSDPILSVEKRARAYLDINCAHCHNPQGIAYMTQLDLRAETSNAETGIWFKSPKIQMRMTTHGEQRMPQLGTTIQHKEGVDLILNYLKNLNFDSELP